MRKHTDVYSYRFPYTHTHTHVYVHTETYTHGHVRIRLQVGSRSHTLLRIWKTSSRVINYKAVTSRSRTRSCSPQRRAVLRADGTQGWRQRTCVHVTLSSCRALSPLHWRSLPCGFARGRGDSLQKLNGIRPSSSWLSSLE